jgi:hypothetical protein
LYAAAFSEKRTATKMVSCYLSLRHGPKTVRFPDRLFKQERSFILRALSHVLPFRGARRHLITATRPHPVASASA